MKYFDTHTHTNIEPLVEEFENILDIAIENNLGFNIVGTNIENSKIAILQAKKNSNLYCSVGIHPNEIKTIDCIEQTINELEKIIIEHKDKIIAIGECGIDLYYSDKYLNEQILWFKAQIELAKKYNLPVMIHTRNATNHVYNIIKNYHNVTFIIHCFNGDKNDIVLFNKLNCYISIPGIITFKNANTLKDAIIYIPKNRLLTETDAPYLSPVPMRGKVNTPNNLIYTNIFIANLLNINLDDFNELLINNIKTLFKNIK